MYNDPVIQKYIDLIKAHNVTIKEYYQGDPIRVPASNLPVCIISKDETRVGKFTNAEDEHGMAMILTIITDIRADMSDFNNLAPGTATLYDIIEGREGDTLKLKADSILNILRSNLTVDSNNGLMTDINSITSADYGMTIGKRTETGWALEATVRFIAHFTQVR